MKHQSGKMGRKRLAIILGRMIKKYRFITMLVLLLYCLSNFSCREEVNTIKSVYNYIEPEYDLIQIQCSSDTLSYLLNDSMSHAIRSFNVFLQDSIEYISFLESGWESINIYNFKTGDLVKRLFLKNYIILGELHRTTVHVKNFDSIFISNKMLLYLLDSAGNVKASFDYRKNHSSVWPYFANTNPPVFSGNKLYAGVRPYLSQTSFGDLKKWKVLYGIDMKNNAAMLYYQLPEMYQKNLYGYDFLAQSYCYNNKGKFVFSFPADSNIYETNLIDYHMSYYGKSRFQDGFIAPISRRELSHNEGYRNYLLRDSYGPIYFDSFRKQYLRVARRAISEADYRDKEVRKKKSSVIIFDEHFKIIGESSIDDEISLSSLFFSANGNIYARTNPSDQKALHFVRLSYQGRPNKLVRAIQR